MMSMAMKTQVQIDRLLTKVNLQISRVPLHALQVALTEYWKSVLIESPKQEYGTISFLVGTTANITKVVATERFLEIWSNQSSPVDTFSLLTQPILDKRLLNILGLSIEMMVVTKRFPAGYPEVMSGIKEPLKPILGRLEADIKAEVEALGMRLYLRQGEDNGLYTFDIAPFFEDPRRQLYLRLTSRRDGHIRSQGFRQSFLNHAELFNNLIKEVPSIILNYP